MSRRRVHTKAGVAAAVVGIAAIAVLARRDPSLPVLAGALREAHLLAGVGLALVAGRVGARLPDWLEPARTPRHRGFWHSRVLGAALLACAAFLAGGYVLSAAVPEIFFLRTAGLFLAIGYLSHLALDFFSSESLPWWTGAGAAGWLRPKTPLLSALRKVSMVLGRALLAAGVAGTFRMFGAALLEESMIWKPLMLGAAAGAALDVLALRRRTRGLHTFMHELAHATLALLFFRRVTRFVSTSGEGGLVQHRGRFGGAVGTTLIALAPYFWPTLTVGCVLVRPLLAPAYFPWYDVAIGATAGFHGAAGLRDLKRNAPGGGAKQARTGKLAQTDIAKGGGLFISAVYILFAALTVYGLLSAVVLEGYAGAIRWVEAVGRHCWLATAVLMESVYHLSQLLAE